MGYLSRVSCFGVLGGGNGLPDMPLFGRDAMAARKLAKGPSTTVPNRARRFCTERARWVPSMIPSVSENYENNWKGGHG